MQIFTRLGLSCSEELCLKYPRSVFQRCLLVCFLLVVKFPSSHWTSVGHIRVVMWQTTFETVLFSTILYFMVGLAGREEPGNYFCYLGLLLVFAILMIQQLAVFAAFANPSTLNAYSACVVFLLILFSGFIVTPASTPPYLYCLYWWNPFAWTYRALVVNEFRSHRWKHADGILLNSGFVDAHGTPFGKEWVRYAFAYTIPYALLCMVGTVVGLTYLRSEGRTTVRESCRFNENGDDIRREQPRAIEIPFKPVVLSFSDICYEVTGSTTKEPLRLLQNVSGVFLPCRMCALMGTSGAGKTTLMVRFVMSSASISFACLTKFSRAMFSGCDRSQETQWQNKRKGPPQRMATGKDSFPAMLWIC